MVHRHLVPIIAVLAPMFGCSPTTPADVEEGLESALEKVVRKDDQVRHAVLHVASPTLGLNGTWAQGVANTNVDVPMTADTPFLSASVGKLFTATTVFTLVDDGLLDLDVPITTWLDDARVDQLPVEGDPRDLTLRHLLTHRSGLPDYFGGSGEAARVDGAPPVLELLVEEPDRSWTPDRTVAYATDHFAPVGRPGEGFAYSDTNYDLIGLVVEAATERSFTSVVRERVLDPLALEQTWYHQVEEPPAGTPALADAWIEEHNIVGTPALSVDWAGGGLATTTSDLALFLRALEEGRPVDLDRFQANWTEDAIHRGIDYGAGLWRIRPGRVSPFLGGAPELVGVSGITGSFAYLVPELDVVITGTFDQTSHEEEHVVFLLTKVLNPLRRLEPVE
jgi:D-alanyl-D-alanine carboxypeptidase